MTHYILGPNGKRGTLTEAMGTSSAFVELITHAYIKDLQNKDAQNSEHTRIMKELQSCKDFNVKVILLYFDNLSPEERKFAEEFFKSYRVIRTYQVPYEPNKFSKWLKEHQPELEQAFGEAGGA